MIFLIFTYPPLFIKTLSASRIGTPSSNKSGSEDSGNKITRPAYPQHLGPSLSAGGPLAGMI
jgi:hypothetical protein